MKAKLVCFGEMLWDVLPDAKLPGGAPMNVAIHLQYQGLAPVVVSRVGNDERGQQLLRFLRDKGVSSEWVQVDEHQETGVVLANIRNRSEVTYDIVQPVAWDYIQLQQGLEEVAAQSDYFIYGSLAARSSTSRHTLLALLQHAKRKVFDVNLRPPHYSREVLEPLLQQANIVKMNHHELLEIANWHHAAAEEKASMALLQRQYQLDMIIVTRGENGAAVLQGEEYVEQRGFEVEVADTIGSGDAFLATFLTQYIAGKSLQEVLRQACAMGALVATQPGATPVIAPEAVRQLMGCNT